MEKYISAEAAADAILDYEEYNQDYNEGLRRAILCVSTEVPAADVVSRDCYDRVLAENDTMREMLAQIGKKPGDKMDDVYFTKGEATKTLIEYFQCSHISESFIRSVIEQIPTADVRPVLRGEWLEPDDDYGYLECSVCEERSPNDERWNFCPNCGAYMRETGR